MSIRLGLSTPVVTRFPGGFSPWETKATPDELARVVAAADALGYDHVTCSEHVAVPTDVATVRGGTYYDPLATLAWFAARTERIRLATSVVVIGYHHPLALAKGYGTLDHLSGGRVVLGVGIGSLEEEFALLGADFRGRGRIADDRLAALASAWGVREPRHEGPTLAYDGLVIEPYAATTRLPLWVGGRTARSLQRAVRLGAGWVPFGLGAAQLRDLLAAVDLPPGFEVVLGPARPLDPQGDPNAAAALLREVRECGATVAQVRLRADSAEHYCAQLAAAAALAGTIDEE